MKRTTLYLSSALILLLAFEFGSFTAGNAQDVPQILCLGDSSLFAGPMLNEGFPNKLQSILGPRARVEHGGVVGVAALGMIGQYHLKYRNGSPAAVIIRIGWNEQFRADWPNHVFAERIESFVKELQTARTRVFIVKWEVPNLASDPAGTAGFRDQFGMSLAEVASRNAECNSILESVCARTRAIYVEPGLQPGHFDAGDAVHPNAAGARHIAEALASHIEPLLDHG